MYLKSFDGKEIFVREWTDVKAPKAVVQIVHGMTEHSARYTAFAQYLNRHGYLVIADDHRGHGDTDPDTLGYCEGNMFEDTVRDEAAIADEFRRRHPGLPYFIFGFSYGSFLTQSFIGTYADKVDAAVIGGSSYKKDFEVYLGSFVASMGGEKKPAKLIDKLSFGAYAKKFEDGQWFSADAANNAAYADDPLCGFVCSNRFYRDFFHGLKQLYTKKYIAGLKKEMPILLVSGENDPVGNMGKGVKKLYEFYTGKAGMTAVEMTLFPGSRHEFLNEASDRDVKWGRVLRFFEEHLSAKD